MRAAVAETHTSTLFFVDDLVYKRKKPLDLGFSDFRDRAARLAACHEEVRLNRRLSPDVYLGVADVLDVAGRPCDHLVVMRRMPDERRLATLLGGPEDLSATLQSLAGQLSALHARSPVPDRLLHVGRSPFLRELWDDGLHALEPFDAVVPEPVRERTRLLARRWLTGRDDLLERRIRDGRLRDGHGDLLADDVFVLPDGPRALDCLEFDERLRVGDGLGDAAFLAMDLESLGSPALARTFLDAYEDAAHDDAPASLEDLYLGYRAHVRSKVTCIRAAQTDQPQLVARARELADLALAHLERGRVRLVLVGGLPGTGKTALSGALAAATGWLRLSSDVTRKRLAGRPVGPAPAVDFRTGLYSPRATDLTYDRLLEDARSSLESGVSVILDASWSDERHRSLARQLAGATAADLVELQCSCDRRQAEARVSRARPGASDATPAIRAALETEWAAWPEAEILATSAELPIALRRAQSLVGQAPRPGLVPPRSVRVGDAG